MSPYPHTATQRPRQDDPRENERPSLDLSALRLGDIRPELYAGTAEKLARAIADSGGRDKNKGTQLRRFYDELILRNEKINGHGSQEERAKRYAELAPLVKMLIAKVAYAKGRGHVDENFERLFRRLIEEVKDPRTLEQAKLFMEAFMGFYKATNKG